MTNLRNIKQEKGFTIIEVVLVLAIAGLIFLIVFLAVPALQRSRRDTQRRADMSRATAALEQYASGNGGNYFTDTAANWTAFVTGYVTVGGSVWSDPSTGATYTRSTVADNAAPAIGSADYGVGKICDPAAPGNFTATGANGRNAGFRTALEGGGVYCVDNH